jgi:nifR3 family TIM-barrel protein
MSSTIAWRFARGNDDEKDANMEEARDPGPFRGRFLLAPLAGWSDAAFRATCRSLGAELAFTEMISAEALRRDHAKTRAMLARDPAEGEYAIQLFGSDPAAMAIAAEEALRYGPALLDVNCGCPVPKIVKNGAGSALLKDPRKIEVIVRAIADAVGGAVPVSVKIRSGWDPGSVNYLETGGAAVAGGAAALTLHARTRTQGYSGKADWSHVAALARAMPVPVAGSGDAFTAAAAVAMLRETGCSAVMIARGAVGNPFVFREARALADGLVPVRPTVAERVTAARAHFELALRYDDERATCREFRKRLCAYTKGMRGGADLRRDAVRAETPADYDALFARWEGMEEGGDGYSFEGTEGDPFEE